VATVLVTGAAGFAGSHLVNLLADSHAVDLPKMVGWHRPGRSPRASKNIAWQPVDLLDRAAVARAIAETAPSIVFHCAGAAHVADSWTDARQTLATNALGTHHLLDGLRLANISARVLIPGSSYVYRQSDHALGEDDPVGPTNPYGLSKLAQEMLGRRSVSEDGQQVFLTRSFNHTGPRQEPSFAAPAFARQIAMIEAGRMAPAIEVGNLDAVRDLTDVRDTVRAYRDIVDAARPGVVYNVCSGRATRIKDVLEQLVSMCRVPVTIRVDPKRYRPNDNPIILGDRTRLEKDTGWTPSIPLERTLSDLLDYWRSEVQ
jgi:GDP-4-dehydro-6-deoxy-D-mannose reductase